MNICVDPIIRDLLSDRGINAVVFDTILSKSEKQQMLEDIEVFASNWFIRNGKDITEYRNVSIGAAIHDDILTLFSYLNHISLVLQKVKYNKNAVVFYQSVSCRLPDNVEKMLFELGVTIKTTNDQYPFLCYKKYFEKCAYTRRAYSGIVYDKYSKTKYISTIKPTIRSMIYKILFKIVKSLFKNAKKTIYIRPMRRLKPMLNNLIDNESNSNGFQIFADFNETISGELLDGHKVSNPLHLFKKLISLAKKGIFLQYPIYMLSPMNSKLHNYANRKKRLSQIKVIGNTKDSIEKLLKINDKMIADYFIKNFINFYVYHLNKFFTLIDKLDRKVRKNMIDIALVEYANPFLAQVLANNNKTIYFIHVSRFLNNQYFCKKFISKVKSRFFILVSSKFELERILKQGFDQGSIIKVRESYFENRNVKKNNAYKIYEKDHFLEDKTVLVTTPTLPGLFTYRLLIDSTFFINFISDIVTTLEQYKIARIIIRSSPDTSSPINSTNFTYADLYNFLLKDIKPIEYTLLIRNELTKNSIEEDLNISDIVIGTPSACAIDAALEGLDYIGYDNSLYPFPDTLNYSIFSKGSPVQMASRKDDLINMLDLFEPSQGRKVINYIRPFKESSGINGSLGNIYSLPVFNFE